MATAHCSFHIMITTLKGKVYYLVPNYNYGNPLNSMNIVDFIKFYNPDNINPHIKLLPQILSGVLDKVSSALAVVMETKACCT